MVVKIEGKDLRVKKGAKGCAGWIPKSETEKNRFQELVLRSGWSSRDAQDEDDGLGALRGTLEEAAAATKVTTTALRNRNKFTVSDEIREMVAEAAKMQRPR